jgi:hypothetical protein
MTADDRQTRKRASDEVWFQRTFLWGSTPTNWKGVAVIATGVAVALGGGDALEARGHPGMAGLLLVATIICVFVVAERRMDHKR